MTTEHDDPRSAFEALHGYWDADLEAILRADPTYFAAYAQLLAVPSRTGRLPARDRELIGVAINAAATHLNGAAVRLHARAATRHGAADAEIAEAIQLASVLGTHTMSFAVPILIEEFERAGLGEQTDFGDLSAEELALKEKFENDRGYWAPHWGAILQCAPEYFEAYLGFSSVPWLHGSLEPRLRELIYVAIDVSTTHLYERGTRVHMRNAIGYGATFPELLDVLVVTSMLGLQSSTVAFTAALPSVEETEPIEGTAR